MQDDMRGKEYFLAAPWYSMIVLPREINLFFLSKRVSLRLCHKHRICHLTCFAIPPVSVSRSDNEYFFTSGFLSDQKFPGGYNSRPHSKIEEYIHKKEKENRLLHSHVTKVGTGKFFLEHQA